MPPELAQELDELAQAAQGDKQVCEALRGWYRPLAPEQLEAAVWRFKFHCSECDGALTDEDWQVDKCPSCQSGLLPF